MIPKMAMPATISTTATPLRRHWEAVTIANRGDGGYRPPQRIRVRVDVGVRHVALEVQHRCGGDEIQAQGEKKDPAQAPPVQDAAGLVEALDSERDGAGETQEPQQAGRPQQP